MIRNKTRKTIITKQFKLCKSIYSKALGLMFRKTITPMLFIFRKERIIDLHMFFVFSPIDLILLNKNKKVIELKENFKPFTFFISKNRAMYVIELPKGAIKKSKTKLNDKVEF